MPFLSKQFEEISKSARNSGGAIPVVKVPKVKQHKLGISSNGLPVFFILCEDAKISTPLDGNLDLIKIEYNRKCELINGGKSIEGVYTIISLKSDSLDLLQYFLDIVYLMLCNLPSKLSMKELKQELIKLSILFSRLVEPPLKSIQGLWAELFVIERASNPDYLIASWHVNPTDKYDFNDGSDKLEIKSTSQSRRIHSFSIEQLNPNAGSELLIGSVMVIQSGLGKNVFDLCDLIESKVTNTNLLFSLKEKVASCLGKDFEKAQEIFFDHQFSRDNLAFFKSTNIPRIDTTLIPVEISKVKFDCDLSGINEVNKKNLRGKLFKATL